MDFKSVSIGLEGVINARDLGGIRVPGGKVRKGLLLRGGSLATATDADLARLRDVYHVTRVFDFRTSMEVGKNPDRDLQGATNIWLPAFDENQGRMAEMSLPAFAYKDLGNWMLSNARDPEVQAIARAMYEVMVTDEFTRMQYAGFLQNIVMTREGAVFWHCSQGKDRTGLGAAFLLAALGADRDAIMEDYEISNEFYAADVAKLCSCMDTEEEKEAVRTFVGVNPRYFSRALDVIEAECGSLTGFLQGPLCLSDEDIKVLRDRYIE